MLRRHRTALTALVWLSFGACYLEHNGDFCRVDSDCHDPAFSHCDTVNNACSSMTSSNDMGMPMIKCTSSASCPFDQPICGSDGQCHLCTTPGTQPPECANKPGHAGDTFCGANGACVECTSNKDCDADHKTCVQTGSMAFTCQPCVHNEDCYSGVCTNGVCNNRSDQLYVDGANPSCSNSGMGSFAVPFCSIQAGLLGSATSLIKEGQTVVVFGSSAHTYTEPLIANNSVAQGKTTGNYTANAIGVNGPVVRPTAPGAALTVAGTSGKKVTLTMDGFTFDGSGLSDMTSDLVDCTGGSANYGDTQLTLLRSTVQKAQALGLSAQSKCSVTLDSDVFYLNRMGGISLVSSDYALSNLLVRGNGTGGTSGSSVGGISIVSAGETGKMTMFNLTVVNNQVKMTPTLVSGIACAAPPTTLANTVVFGNTGGGFELFYNDCTPTYSAFVDSTAASPPSAMNENFSPVGGKACTATDIFVDPTNTDPSKVSFVPKAGAAKPCALVDLGTMVGAPDHDLVGNKRTNTPDIGAYEVQ